MVARLIDDDPLPNIVAAIKEDVARQVEGAFTHNGLSEDAYRIAIGYVRGLNRALQIIEDATKQREDS